MGSCESNESEERIGTKKSFKIRFDWSAFNACAEKEEALCQLRHYECSAVGGSGGRWATVGAVVPLSGMSSIFHGNCRNLSQHRVSPSGNVERESNHGVTLRSAAAAPSASARRYHPPHPRPSAILRPSPLARDAPDEILRSDAGCLNGGTDKTASGQPYSPRRTDDAQSQTEGDAEVGIAVRRHVGEDLAPPGVAVL